MKKHKETYENLFYIIQMLICYCKYLCIEYIKLITYNTKIPQTQALKVTSSCNTYHYHDSETLLLLLCT